jgi:crotonobetainyl-CoA:carnitine CoA-transferase CaiB-like acyl-CoA transferase
LLAQADILFNPNAPRLNQRLGLDPSLLCARFPRLVVVSTTFFGVDSPYRDLRGGDLIATHMSIVGHNTPMQQVTDSSSQPPLRLGGRQSDYMTGYTAAAAALSALLARERNGGSGQHVDVSQWLSMVQMCRPEISVFTHETPDAPYYRRLLSRTKTSLQYMFPCRDGWVSCALSTNRHWRALKRLMDNPEWAESELFATFEGRLENSDAIEALLVEWLSMRNRKELFDLAQAGHVPVFPVNTPSEVAHNPQYAARGYFADCDHPVAGKVRMPGAPIIFSRTPWRISSAAPRLGEHNAAILGERLGLTRREVEAIAEKAATLVAGACGEIGSGASKPSALGPGAPRGHLPFEGIRVADFGWIYAMPYATAWLGALGADVIKVESTVRPDVVRYLCGTDGVNGVNRSAIFNGINFSKRSLVLNLGRPEAREIAFKLVALSDIATENFTSATMPRLGLAYDDLRRVRPDLIMISGTSLGQTGPLANTVGWGPTNQAFAGTSHLTGYPDSFPCAGGGTWPDFAVAVAMVFAVVAALHHRARTGEGQYIDVSMCEVVTSMLPEAMLEYFMNGREMAAIGNQDPEMAPHGVYPARGDDRWIAIAIVDDAEFAALCEVLGAPALATDPGYATVAARLANVETLDQELSALTPGFDRDDLAARLRERNLCAAPVLSTEDLVTDAAFKASGMLVKLNHKESGERIVPGLPARFSALQPDYRPAPLIGEHTEEILTRLLGYSADEVERFRDAKIIV